MSGKPPMRYGISAARLPEFANAAAIRSDPRPANCSPGLVTSLWADPGGASLSEDLGEVLVAAPAQADQVAVGVAGLVQHVVERVRGLQRRDDPFEPRDLAEGRQRIGVGDRDVGRPP